MKVDWSAKGWHLAAAEQALSTKFEVGAVSWLGVVEGEELLAVFVFHNFCIQSCELSAVTFGAKSFSRKIFRELFSYPFVNCKLRRLHAIVSVTNARSLDCTRRLGFKVEGLLRSWYPDSDGIMHGMLKEECKWLK